MSAKIIFSLLRVSISIVYFLMITTAFFCLVIAVLNIIDGNNHRTKNLNVNVYTQQVSTVGIKDKNTPLNYSADSVVSFRNVSDRFAVQIAPNSVMGYYTLAMNMLFLAIGIGVLWNFKEIFQETNLDDPFKRNVIRRLKMLAALFIISDILKFIHYFVFNSLLHQSLTTPKFQLVTESGNGLITGLIIWIIAVIYKRGIVLQEENALTV